MITGKRLLDLTAAELMSRDVVTITQPMSLQAAAHRLALAGVSGAPVVDERGRCVGVLSSIDLLRFMDQAPQVPESTQRRGFQGSGCFCSEWQVADIEMLPVDDVSRYMTTDVVTAQPEMRLGQLAQCMLDAHIHRLIVVDAWGQPIGIVSSTDVLAAVASLARDEMEAVI